MDEQQSKALEYARIYRGLGLIPLPSRSDDKRPTMASYAEFRNSPVPDEIYTEAHWRAHNVQIMTGAKTSGSRKLVVVDCDGELAHAAWLRICKFHGYTPKTWLVKTGGGGFHYWFLLSQRIHECPTKQIWALWDTWGTDGNGAWTKHAEVKILGDGALAVAPPSIHVETGRRYALSLDISGERNIFGEVSQCPSWLLSMPRAHLPRTAYDGSPKGGVGPPFSQTKNIKKCAYLGSESRRVVLDSIPDKQALAHDWGLRFAGSKPNQHGWISCWAVERDGNRPSGSFHVETGVYFDFNTCESYSLLDLGVLLGHFADWRACLSSLHPSPELHP